jgi:hypothetical protein
MPEIRGMVRCPEFPLNSDFEFVFVDVECASCPKRVMMHPRQEWVEPVRTRRGWRYERRIRPAFLECELEAFEEGEEP